MHDENASLCTIILCQYCRVNDEASNNLAVAVFIWFKDHRRESRQLFTDASNAAAPRHVNGVRTYTNRLVS